MKTFIAIIMGLATLRTIVPLANPETYKGSFTKVIAVLAVAITQVLAFWWLCELFFTEK